MLTKTTVSQIVKGVKSPDGTAKGYAIELMTACRKAGVASYISKLQLLMAKRYLKTRDTRYWETMCHLRLVETLVLSYNEKSLLQYRGYFRGLLRGYRIL